MGYIICRPVDTLYLDMPDDSLTVTDVGPLVWFGMCRVNSLE